MDATTDPPLPAPEPRVAFATTRWSLVLQARDRSSPDSDRALAELCRIYWFPLYTFIRRQGHPREDAEDLVQSFFSHLLPRNDLAGLAAERGRFRSFLLAALKNFLANARDRARRHKRGGNIDHLSIDWHDAEARFQVEAPDSLAPDRAFDRAWSIATLERVLDRLHAECEDAGTQDHFAQTRGYLMLGDDAIPYPDAARALGIDEASVRSVVHRLRRRYRELLREEIRQTLADPAQVQEELHSLRAALRGSR